MMRATGIGLGFPVDTTLRDALRARFGHPLPAVYPGSVAKPCAGCGISIWVGPRTQAAGVPCFCFVCAVAIAGADAPVVDLGNPEGGWET